MGGSGGCTRSRYFSAAQSGPCGKSIHTRALVPRHYLDARALSHRKAALELVEQSK